MWEPRLYWPQLGDQDDLKNFFVVYEKNLFSSGNGEIYNVFDITVKVARASNLSICNKKFELTDKHSIMGGLLTPKMICCIPLPADIGKHRGIYSLQPSPSVPPYLDGGDRPSWWPLGL